LLFKQLCGRAGPFKYQQLGLAQLGLEIWTNEITVSGSSEAQICWENLLEQGLDVLSLLNTAQNLLVEGYEGSVFASRRVEPFYE
jgi:hypothetical protein